MTAECGRGSRVPSGRTEAHPEGLLMPSPKWETLILRRIWTCSFKIIIVMFLFNTH